ncbi:hypothetical protein [Pseudarthrobacter sp. S9]|uniref:hypothetical protein n=1 Tax=Pseudarthrobacter sp. S9 TaxID=3418421 RepID=UPI003D0084A5
MATVRSRMARRRAPVRKTRIVRVKVHKHHPRRYAGVKGATPSHRKAKVNKTGRHHRFLGRKKHVGPRAARGHAAPRLRKGRHGHRKFRGRKKSLHPRHTRAGLHRKFRGRKYHGRHVKPGLHRKYLGRKTTHHKGRISRPKPATQPISSASYLSMF